MSDKPEPLNIDAIERWLEAHKLPPKEPPPGFHFEDGHGNRIESLDGYYTLPVGSHEAAKRLPPEQAVYVVPDEPA